MRHSELIRLLSQVGLFDRPERRVEQVATPPSAAAALLEAAVAAGDLEDREVLDLGCGTGLLAIGAALEGARAVVGVDSDGEAVERARENALRLGVSVRFVSQEVSTWSEAADTVVMNPPFGAQRKRADRPFFERAIALARHAVYAFSSRASRTFIAKSVVDRGARIEVARPVPWELPRTFPHHRKARVPLDVDLWVLRIPEPVR